LICPEQHMILQVISMGVLTAGYTYYSSVWWKWTAEDSQLQCAKKSRVISDPAPFRW